MNQVSFDISSEWNSSAGATDAAGGGAAQVRSTGVGFALGCVERPIVRLFGITGLDRVIPLHETVAAPPRHELHPVAA